MSHATVCLAPTRAEQLRQIARVKGVPAVALVDGLIVAEWKALGRAPALPGFDFAAGRDDVDGSPVVIFAASGTEPVFLTPSAAREVAQGLRDLAARTAPRFVVAVTCAGYRAGLIGDRIGAHGFSLKIADNLDRDAKAVRVSGLSASIAADLADAFDAAADEAVQA